MELDVDVDVDDGADEIFDCGAVVDTSDVVTVSYGFQFSWDATNFYDGSST